MRYFILIILALGLGVSACSKKKSAAAPPAQAYDNDDGYYPGGNDNYFATGRVYITDVNAYRNFLYTFYGYQTTQQYSYSFSCGTDLYQIFDWVLGYGKWYDCNSGQNSFNDLLYKPAYVELLLGGYQEYNGYSANSVEGLWVVDPSYGGGREIPFQGYLRKNSKGLYYFEAGPLGFVNTVDGNGNVRRDNFDIYYIWYDNYGRHSTRFGNVTVKESSYNNNNY